VSRGAPVSLLLEDKGISRFHIPNPYFEGPTNVYLIEGRELVLIDTGIGTPATLAELEAALSRQGHALCNLRHIFLTHKHIDHFGLAYAIRERSGARVYVHEADYDEVAHFEERRAEVAERYRTFLTECGVPSEAIRSLTDLNIAFTQLGRSVSAEVLRDGQHLMLGDGDLKVIHTPGHTLGSVCFQYGNLLFSGDHLLPNYTPNVGATDVDTEGLLSQYLSSLEKISRLTGITMALPGHGEPIEDIPARIAIIEAHHQQRLQQILEAISADKPESIYEIALWLFGPLREHHVLLGCGEVHAHLAVLLAQGRVRQIGRSPGRYVWER
jgi:glyoxylase-like metal-dependent hydrolase (beta-lactamase superfamily II)